MTIAIPSIRNVSPQVMPICLMPQDKSVFAEIDCEDYRRENRACSQQCDGDLFAGHIKIILHFAALHKSHNPATTVIYHSYQL
jgi:hypothetical protein